MAVIAVYSVKGGVGKTTIAANLAWCSAAISCRKTLLWDLDAAGGAGFLYGIDPKKKHAAESVFSKDADPEQLIRKTDIPRLDILPADESLREIAETTVRPKILHESLVQSLQRVLPDEEDEADEVGSLSQSAEAMRLSASPGPLELGRRRLRRLKPPELP